MASCEHSLGCLGTVKPELLKHWDIDKPVHFFELDFTALTRTQSGTITFKPLPRFPSLWRDVSLLVDTGVPVTDLVRTIQEYGAPLVNRVELFDRYQGERIPAGKQSLAFRLEYRSDEKTLTEEEAADAHQKIISVLHSTFNAQLRSL